MVAALDDDAHVDVQRSRYLARRSVLRPALEAAGFVIEHSEGVPTFDDQTVVILKVKERRSGSKSAAKADR